MATEGDEFILSLPEAAELEPTLATLREAGVAVADPRLSQPDLEDVFVRVMRQGA